MEVAPRRRRAASGSRPAGFSGVAALHSRPQSLGSRPPAIPPLRQQVSFLGGGLGGQRAAPGGAAGVAGAALALAVWTEAQLAMTDAAALITPRPCTHPSPPLTGAVRGHRPRLHLARRGCGGVPSCGCRAVRRRQRCAARGGCRRGVKRRDPQSRAAPPAVRCCACAWAAQRAGAAGWTPGCATRRWRQLTPLPSSRRRPGRAGRAPATRRAARRHPRVPAVQCAGLHHWRALGCAPGRGRGSTGWRQHSPWTRTARAAPSGPSLMLLGRILRCAPSPPVTVHSPLPAPRPCFCCRD